MSPFSLILVLGFLLVLTTTKGVHGMGKSLLNSSSVLYVIQDGRTIDLLLVGQSAGRNQIICWWWAKVSNGPILNPEPTGAFFSLLQINDQII